MIRTLLAASLLSTCIGDARASAQDAEADLQFVWEGMKDHRQRLRSGVLKMNGRMLDHQPGAWKLDGDVAIFIAFDEGGRRLRFDRSEPVLDPETRGSGEARQMTGGGRYVRLPDRSYSYVNGELITETREPDETISTEIRPFDVRGLGLYYWLDLAEGGVYYDEIVGNWEKVQPDRTVDEGDGLYRVEWTLADGALRRLLWIDESRGFAPVRFELLYRDESAEGGWSEPKVVSETSWEQSGDAWIPASYRLEDFQGAPRHRLYELAIRWESVNEPVAPPLFTLEGLELDRGIVLVDRRLGRPIPVGEIGAGHEPVMSFSAPIGDDSAPGSPTPRRYLPIVLLAVAPAILAALVYAYRSRRVPGDGRGTAGP
jgi:hypothetical protein